MRLSISTKIFCGFLLVLLTFGGVATYDAVTMRRLGDELRLVSRGYLELQLALAGVQSAESNLLKVLVDQRNKPAGARVPPFVKAAVDDARRSRLSREIPAVLGDLATLEALPSSGEEHALLRHLRTKVEHIEHAFRADEELFDAGYGPVGDPPAAMGDVQKAAAELLLRAEQQVKREVDNLASELRLRAEEIGLRLEKEESRAVWATLLLASIALVVSLAVMVIAARTLRPLALLASRARQIAQGDYQQRVESLSSDEIGALGREFNAMAQALDEREQRLIRSERLAAVGKIAAQITHEVRNPLSSIGLNAELLEDELSGIPRAKEAQALVRAIGKEVDRLTDITENYLRFARLPQPRLEREELGEMVRNVMSFVRGELDAQHIALEIVLPEHAPSVFADENQLRQSLLNLVRNAAEAMAQPSPGPSNGNSNGESGKLTVRLDVTTAAPVQLLLSVTDTGPGIPLEHRDKIFDPFFTTKKGGTGLGLALTQQIIVEHGGSLEVTGGPENRGTTFTIRLPAAAAPLALDGAAE